MFSAIVGVALIPLSVYRSVADGIREMSDITDALNHFADESVEMPDNLFDMFNWKA